MKINAVIIAALLSVSTLAAPQAQRNSLLQKAREAYTTAQSLEAELMEKAESDRSRADYLKVIKAYQRVYLITPRIRDPGKQGGVTYLSTTFNSTDFAACSVPLRSLRASTTIGCAIGLTHGSA